MEARKASKKNVKLKICLAGLAGTGKTLGSLMIAKGLVKDMSKVLIVETETGRSDYYATRDDVGGFDVIDLKAPFTPEKYIEAMNYAEEKQYKIVILDSISDEWKQIVHESKNDKYSKGGHQIWGKLTPRHDAFFDKLMNSSVHVIATTRKGVVKMDGNDLKRGDTFDIQRDDCPYKWAIQFDITEGHEVKVIKDNTSLFDGKKFVISEGVGSAIRDWCLS